MDPARNGVNEHDGMSVKGRHGVRACVRLVGLAVLLLVATPGQSATPPKPSPTPNPMIGQMDNVVAELREINATLASLRTAITELGGRLDTLDGVSSEINEVKATALPMREEVRGLYVETSNVRSEIARLEEKSVAEAESLGKSRYVFTLLLVATMVLQVVVLAALLRR
jgi:hypothetical protein